MLESQWAPPPRGGSTLLGWSAKQEPKRGGCPKRQHYKGSTKEQRDLTIAHPYDVRRDWGNSAENECSNRYTELLHCPPS